MKKHKDKSKTQVSKTYVLRYGDITVRLIDTLNIGGTHGIEKVRENFQNIMTHLSPFDEIHAICVLLTSNSHGISAMFDYIFKELLTNLHEDACVDVVFCFTNGRRTFFQLRDTLKTLLRFVNAFGTKLTHEAVYCVDNEAVRFIAAIKCGLKCTDGQYKRFCDSWHISAKENKRLLEYISALQPLKIKKNQLTSSEARRMILP